MPLAVRPVGEPPTAVWFLQLPLTSGKLVLHMWYPVRTSPQGAVTQDRADYKVAIRRKAPATARLSRRSPSPCFSIDTAPVLLPPTTFADSGR